MFRLINKTVKEKNNHIYEKKRLRLFNPDLNRLFNLFNRRLSCEARKNV